MATKIKFLYDNLLDDATLTASGADADYPVANLKDPLRTKVFKPDAATWNLVINHGAATAVSAVAIVNQNWTSAPSTLDFEMHTADSWGTPDATEALTWTADPDTNLNPSIIIKAFTSTSKQYNRLNVVHATVTPEIGRIFVGTYFAPASNYLIGWDQGIEDISLITSTPDGYEHSDIRGIRRTFNGVKFQIKTSSYSDIQAFQKMFRTVGFNKDLIIAFNYDSYPNELTLYGKFTDFSIEREYYYNVEFSFKESL